MIDADLIAKQVTLPGQPAYKKVVTLFPECIIPETNLIDRPKLGKLVFANPDKRRELEKAVHPAVIKEMIIQMIMCWLQGHARIIVDVPLLYESGLDKYMNYVIVLSSDEQTMLQRLFDRNGLDDTHARLMIRSQMPLDEKCRRAAVVIRNEKSIEDLFEAVDAVLEERKPSKIIHSIGLWMLPIASGIALTSYAALKLYEKVSKK